jgi:cytochrome P450 family 109
VNPRNLMDQLLYPYESFTALRESYGPISYNKQEHCWEVFNYDDVLKLASDYETFSSDGSQLPEHSEMRPEDRSILNTDPPRHRQLRSLLTQAFTPRALALMTPRITAIAKDLLDSVLDQGSMDIVTDLSYPLPVIVISEMLGVPAEDRARFKKWSDDMVISEYDDIGRQNIQAYRQRVQAVVRRTLDELYDYFRVVMMQRRLKPQQDLISTLLAAQIEGEALTEQEILAFCALLLIAGNITTTNLIANAMLCFDENPVAVDLLQKRPELLPQAIEEILRYRAPAVMVGRYTTRDIELSGQQIQSGQLIIGWTASANFDPAQFAQPQRFDIERTSNRHLAFGHGIHFCLGAPLARLEAKIVLGILLERIQHIHRQQDYHIETLRSSFILGPKHLPITFTPR